MVFKYLNIKTKIIFSSDLKLEKKKSERLIEICKNKVDLYKYNRRKRLS